MHIRKETKFMNTNYTDYMIEQTCNVLAIDSPTGFTANAAKYVMEEYEKMGFSIKQAV